MKRCPKCNSECEDKNHFCTKCGTFLPQPKFCNKCGTRLNEGERFCTHCGERIEDDFPMTTPQNAQNETVQKTEETGILYQNGLQKQNTSPVNGIEEETQEVVNRRVERKPYNLNENSENFSEEVNLLGESHQNSGTNKTKIWVGIIAVVVIIAGVVFWLYREGYFGSNGSERADVPIEEGMVEMEVVEDIPVENTAELTDLIQGISGNDIVYLSGKIDAKYPVHMILDLRQRIGGYYYDKYGPSNFIGVEIPQLRSLGDGRWLITLSISTANGDIDEKWHGTLTYEKFYGNGLYLGKEMPFDLDVDSVITESKDPLIEKVHSNGANWKSYSFDGEVHAGGKIFKVRITAKGNQNGEFKDGTYYNLSYNVNFPVDVRTNGDQLYISGKSGNSDFSIEASNQRDGGYEGHMYADGKSLPITFDNCVLVVESAK